MRCWCRGQPSTSYGLDVGFVWIVLDTLLTLLRWCQLGPVLVETQRATVCTAVGIEYRVCGNYGVFDRSQSSSASHGLNAVGTTSAYQPS